MEKEEISKLAQLLSAMKDSAIALEGAERKKDFQKTMAIKAEIMNLQKQIGEVL